MLARVAMLVMVAVFAARPCCAQCSPEWSEHGHELGLAGRAHAMVAWDSDGIGPEPEWLVIGGEFMLAGQTPVRNLAAWDGSSWRDVGGGVEGAVQSLAVHDGELIVGGRFQQAGNQAAEDAAAWNGVSWRPMDLPSTYVGVQAIVTWNGDLFVAAYDVRRWTGSGWEDLPRPGGTGIVHNLAVYNGELIAACFGDWGSLVFRWTGDAWVQFGSFEGQFTSVRAMVEFNGQLVAATDYLPGVFIWDGEVWSYIGSPFGWDVFALAVSDGALVAGGVSGAGRWKGGQAWESSGFDGTVFSLADHGGGLFAAGSFHRAGSAATHSLARSVGTEWVDVGGGIEFRPGPVRVNTAMLWGDRVVLGGRFETAGGVYSPSVMAWDGDEWQAIGNGLRGFADGVRAIIEYDGGLVAGGVVFFEVDGLLAPNVARWDGQAWRAMGAGLPAGFGSGVHALVEYHDGQIIAAGGFRAGASVAEYVAAWNGSAWAPVGYPHGRPVLALAVYDDEVIAMADDGVSHAWDGTTWRSFAPPLELSMVPARRLHMMVHEGMLYVAGPIDRSGSTELRGLARWDGAGWSAVGGGITEGSWVTTALGIYEQDLVVSGEFSGIGGVAASRVARWDGAAWHALADGIAFPAYGLAGAGDHLVAGGTVGSDMDERALVSIFRCPCRADCDGSGVVTLADFLCFRGLFVAGDLRADFDGSGDLTLNDFVRFRNEYIAGCG